MPYLKPFFTTIEADGILLFSIGDGITAAEV